VILSSFLFSEAKVLRISLHVRDSSEGELIVLLGANIQEERRVKHNSFAEKRICYRVENRLQNQFL
jgi:hypothetical protein